MTPKVPSTDDLRMSSNEFDRIMGQALQVKPEDAKKPKASDKLKKVVKKQKAQK